MALYKKWIWFDRTVYRYPHVTVVGNQNEGWGVFANKDIEFLKGGRIRFDPYSDFGTFPNLGEAQGMARALELALSKGNTTILEYGGKPVKHEGAGYGSIYRSGSGKGIVISYPAGYPSRALHEWGHDRLHGQHLGDVEEEEQATRLAIHVLRREKKYTPRLRQDFVQSLATFYEGDWPDRRGRAVSRITRFEKEPLLELPPLEDWQKQALESKK